MRKARYVAQGFNDDLKHEIVHNVTSLKPSSVRIILSTASNLRFRVFCHDMVQVYLQSLSPLSRKVYIKPKKENYNILGIKHDELLLLRKPLYGMCDAGDCWNETICEHLCEDLMMKLCITDPSLWLRLDNGKLIGIVGNYVDDNLNAGTKSFEKTT